jgi:hypothetical protein
MAGVWVENYLVMYRGLKNPGMLAPVGDPSEGTQFRDLPEEMLH